MDRPLGALKPSTRWVGRPLEHAAVLDSTNLRVEELARQGAPEGTVVIADRQTAGRGRVGRSFFSPAGVSLYLSLLLRPQVGPERLHEHVFVASLAVARIAAAHVASERVAIKWPNDVQIDGRKTAGINAPAQIADGRVQFLVLGIGVNVNTPQELFPEELQATATSLAIAAGHPLDRTAVAEALLCELERGIDALRASGFPALLDEWRAYFRMRGTRVRIGGPGIAVEREGIAEDVDIDGALILRVRHGDRVERERVLAGDVALLEER
jgi:BirA family transcriptional regulator, biotin operon repressor / biotin---[acetyl-CoA-carboxylase] ligase